MVLLIVFVFTGAIVQAQRLFPNSVYVQAEQYFQEKKYFEAAQLYEKYLTDDKHLKGVSDPFLVRKRGKDSLTVKKTPRQDATFNLAESYRLTHDFKQAEKWYEEAIALPDHNPLSEYWYGVTLRSNEKFEKAFEVLTAFVEYYSPEDEWKQNARHELNNLQFIKEQANKKTVPLFIRPEINERNKSAYALVIPDKKTFAFTSIYVDSAAIKKGRYAYAYFARLFTSVESRTIMDSALILPIESQKGYHEGLAAFTNDGQTMIFTRWANKDGARISALYRCFKINNGWSKPEKLGAPFNIEGSNSTQPFITEDQKFILFSSNRPGGSGNYDIWYASVDGNLSAAEATNMGSAINTKGDDMSPYYHQQTNKLVFSSNGRVGMGGFDIYSAAGDISTSQWEEVSNPGSPINSSKDDLYFISTDEETLWRTGWFSSDRNSDCCLEIFAYRQDNSQYVSGIVIDKVSRLPIPGAIITLKDLAKEDDNSTNTAIADSNGRYQFNLTNTKTIQVKAGKPGYDSASVSYAIHLKTGFDSLLADTILLTATRLYDPDVVRTGTDPPDSSRSGELFDPDPGDKAGQESDQDVQKSIGTIRNQLIHFDFDKSIIKEEYFVFLDSIISVMQNHPSLKIAVGGHTDAFGTPTYNDRLGQERTKAIIGYLVHRGIDANRLSGTSFGETLPIASEKINGEDDSVGRYMNRRVEFRLLQQGSKIPVVADYLAGSRNLQKPTAQVSVETGRQPDVIRNGKTSDYAGEFAIIVNYSFDKAVINNSYYRSLDTLAQMMKASPSLRLKVNGHTDTRGSDAYNLQLANERVESCIRYLVKKGIAKERFTGSAYGECCPVAQETVNGKDDPKARWTNRRVEFKWLKE